MATIYICKCGRRVSKSTNADNTGNRDTDGCKGCPYLLPWGPFEFVESQGFVRNVRGYECRMSKDIEYATRFCGSIDDKCSCYIASLDFDFLTRVSNWIKETYPGGELNGSFFTDDIRAVEYVSNGRYRMSIGCAQNKKGIAAKAALLHQFFDASGARLDMTPEEEKVHILASIEAGKAKASGKEKDMQVYTNQYGTLFAVREHNGSPALMCKAKESEQWVMSGVLAAVKDDAKTIGELQAVLDKAAQKYNWEPVENVPVENPTNAAEDVQQCAPTASNAPLSQSQSVNADAQQGGGDDSGEPAFTVGKTIPAGTEARRRVQGYAAMRCGEVSVIHVCRQKPESVQIWLNSMMPSEYWVMSKSGDVCGEHVEFCPYCEADLKNGEGDVLIVPFGHSENFTHAAPVSPVDAGAATQSPSDAGPASLEVESELDVAMKGHSSEECQECGIASDKCRCKECLREGCRDYPGTAYCVIGNNVCPGRVTKETSAPGADGSTAFDYSSLDDQTVADLHLAEREYSSGKKMAEMGLRRMADAVAIAHDALCGAVVHMVDNSKHGNRGEDTFRCWCESIGVGKTTAYKMLQVSKLMDDSSPREQKVLEELSPSLLYAAAKPSAPAELVQAVKDGDIATHKQYQEALAEIKARDAKIQELLEMSENSDRRADRAEAKAKKAEQERDAARDAQANLSAMANKFSKQRDAAEQRVEDAERRAQAAEEDAAGWKQAGLEMQELVDQRDERIRELESGITVEAAAVDQEEIERRANELSEPLVKIIDQQNEQIERMASGNTVSAQASVLEQYLGTMKTSLLGNARRAELACYDVGALDSLAQALRAFADEIDGLFEEGEENEDQQGET